MITKFKIYEGKNYILRDKFIKVKDESYVTFSLDKLFIDCCKYDIYFFDLLKEMVLNKIIAFKCNWCYDIRRNSNFENSPRWAQDLKKSFHNIIDKCVNIDHQDKIYNDSDILVKLENEHNCHTLFMQGDKQKIRIYNYNEGPLMQKLNMLKDAEKYNL